MRVASLLSSATEMLYAIGLGDCVVAVSHECDYPPEAASKPRATFSRIDSEQSSQAIDDQVKQLMAAGEPLYEINRDLLRKLRPHLIVTQAQCDVCAVKYDDVLELVRTETSLEETQVLALNPMSLEEILQDILRIGEAANCIAASQSFVDSLRTRIARTNCRSTNSTCLHGDIRQSNTNSQQRESVGSTVAGLRQPRVAVIEWIEPLMLAANWTPELIELAGGENGLTTGGQHSDYSRWEDVLTYDPEVLIVAPCGFDLERTLQEARVLPTWQGWSEMTAVKNDRVFALDGNAYLNRSGPRIVDTIEMLASMIHPTLFTSRNSGFCKFTS